MEREWSGPLPCSVNMVRGAKDVVMWKHSIKDDSRHPFFGDTTECSVVHRNTYGDFLGALHPLAIEDEKDETCLASVVERDLTRHSRNYAYGSMNAR